MMWNVETEWQVHQLRHEELLQTAQRWRLVQKGPELSRNRLTHWLGARRWIGCRLIALGEQLAAASPRVQLEECCEHP